jgi:5-methylcytosine-specific restriction endonuclease McrA
LLVNPQAELLEKSTENSADKSPEGICSESVKVTPVKTDPAFSAELPAKATPEPTPDAPAECSPVDSVEFTTVPQQDLLPPAEVKVETRVEIKFTLSEDAFKRFEEVKAALSNKFGAGASVEEIFNELMSRYLKIARPKSEVQESPAKSQANNYPAESRAQSKPAQSDFARMNYVKDRIRVNRVSNFGPRVVSPKIITRHIPRALRRAVLQRDSYSCTYVASDGRRCACKAHLHLDHIRPFSVGGEHSQENLRVLCSAHNQAREIV